MMKRLTSLILIIAITLIAVQNSHAQKSDGTNVAIHYAKVPKYRLKGKTYRVALSSTDAIAKQYSEYVANNIKYYGKDKVKGSADLTVLLSIENPVITTETRSYPLTEAGKTTTYYVNQANISSENSLKIIDNEGFPIYSVQLPINGFDDNTVKFKSYASQAEAGKNTKADFEGAIKMAIQKHIETATNFYDLKIRDELGEFQERIAFEVYSGKGKKMDYSELDTAINRYKKAAEIYSKSGKTDVTEKLFNQAIEAWEKAISEYVPGKDSKVSDRNVGEFYHSIACASVWLDRRDKALVYEEKALKFDDNKRDKEKVVRFVNEYNANLSSIDKFDSELPARRAAFNKEIQAQVFKGRISEVIISSILDMNLCEVNGNIVFLNNYYPCHHPKAKKIEQENKYGDKTVENVTSSFLSNGKIDALNYKIANGINGDKDYTFSFLYAGNKLESVTLNGSKKLGFLYNATNQIIEIIGYKNNEPQASWAVTYPDEKTIQMELSVFQNGKKMKSQRPYSIKLNDQNLIADRRMDLYHDKYTEYNASGLPVKGQIYNPNSDQWVDQNYSLVMDENGNWTKLSLSDKIVQTRKITY